MDRGLTRRELLWLGALALSAPLTARGVSVLGAPSGEDSYGALGDPDLDGVRVPSGFTVRVIGRSGHPVGTTGHVWHAAPDGGACFAVPGGGWVYVSNSELDGAGGGVSAVRFDGGGSIVDAYSIATGTSRNCSGGSTSWGTWLTCEETDTGQVFECDPLGSAPPQLRPALGRFRHEAAAEDQASGHIYLTEDQPDGRLYRFVPTTRGDLSAGSLYAASLSAGRIGWVPVAPGEPARGAATTAFDGGEGIVVDGSSLLFTTKGDDRIWDVDLRTGQVTVLFDGATTSSALSGVDQIVVHPGSRDLYIAEDGGNLELIRIVQGPGRRHGSIEPFLQFAGHTGSEVTGPAFSPDGSRLYLSSQRGSDGVTGLTIEISGPFRLERLAASVSGRHPAVRLSS